MHTIEIINKLLQNELSAMETYQQALDKLKEDVSLGEAAHLIPIHEHHKAAVSSLQALCHDLGGTPITASGAWGTWAKLVLGGASILGKESALKALQEGEKSGATDYEDVLKDPNSSLAISSLIETKLLPAQQEHIQILDRLLEAVSS